MYGLLVDNWIKALIASTLEREQAYTKLLSVSCTTKTIEVQIKWFFMETKTISNHNSSPKSLQKYLENSTRSATENMYFENI